jgi:IS1 family transposase
VLVWTAYSRRRDKIIAHTIGVGIEAAIEIYRGIAAVTGCIEKIYSDGNSCYEEAFKKICVANLLEISIGKTKTHMIESTNSSMRDNLARFNRKSKRFSKTYEMLDNTVLLFSDYKKFNGKFYTSV